MADILKYKKRPVNDADIEFVEALYIDTMKPLLSEINAWDEAHYRSHIRKIFKPDESAIIVIDGQDAGVLQLTSNPGDLNIAQLHLLPEFRGQGVGTSLLNDILGRAALSGKTVSLSSPRTNRAIDLYKRLGFRTVGDTEGAIVTFVRETSDLRLKGEAHNSPA